MAIYRFKVSFEDYDDIIREIDIKTNQTFEDLHRAIHQSTGYNADLPSSFYVSTDNWIKGEEIAIHPNQRKIDNKVTLMENSKLSSFIEDPHQKFYYIYNFERPYDFHVQLIKIILENDPNIEYPYLVKSVGVAPKIMNQFTVVPDDDDSADVKSEFDFLNELDFVPEDTDELEALGDSGINTKEGGDDEEEESEFGGDDEYGADEEYNDKDDY